MPSLQGTNSIIVVNQTNLALKGIIGIGAMAKISSVVGQSEDADRYENIASSYVQKWRALALSPDNSHIMASYGHNESFSLLYNLYAHQLLQLDLVLSSDFAIQSAFYKSKLVSTQYGLPLDSNTAELSRSDWMMFTAAMVTDDTLRDTLISQLHAYASSNVQNQPFEVVYNPVTGDQISGSSSPAQGAMFALLANDVPVKLSPRNISTGTFGKHKHTSNVEAIKGGAIATAVITVCGVFFFYHRRACAACLPYLLKILKRFKPYTFSSVLEPYDLSAMCRSPKIESLPTLPPHKSQISPPPPPPLDPYSYWNHRTTDGANLRRQRLPQPTPADDTGETSSMPCIFVPSRTTTPAERGVRTQNLGNNLQSIGPEIMRESEMMNQVREATEEAPPLYRSVLEGC